MSKIKTVGLHKRVVPLNPHRRTSIGRSSNSMPSNKHKRRNWKKYRGQG